MMPARRAFVAAVSGLLAWTALNCAVEVYRCGWARFNDPWPASEPGRWRFLSGHVDDLRSFLDDTARDLPADARIAVSFEPGPESAGMFRSLWAAYLLPSRDVHLTRAPADGLAADYWIAYGTRVKHPRLETVVEDNRGAVYRVRPGKLAGEPPSGRQPSSLP